VDVTEDSGTTLTPAIKQELFGELAKAFHDPSNWRWSFLGRKILLS
jgi:hypothetical protein